MRPPLGSLDRTNSQDSDRHVVENLRDRVQNGNAGMCSVSSGTTMVSPGLIGTLSELFEPAAARTRHHAAVGAHDVDLAVVRTARESAAEGDVVIARRASGCTGARWCSAPRR